MWIPKSSSPRARRARSSRGSAAGPPPTRDGLQDVLHRLSRLAEDVPELAELDLNPVLAFADRVVVVDARIRLARVAEPTDLKGW